jgi:hypothetical protein
MEVDMASSRRRLLVLEDEAAMAGIGPRDELEGMIAAQLIAARFAFHHRSRRPRE